MCVAAEVRAAVVRAVPAAFCRELQISVEAHCGEQGNEGCRAISFTLRQAVGGRSDVALTPALAIFLNRLLNELIGRRNCVTWIRHPNVRGCLLYYWTDLCGRDQLIA